MTNERFRELEQAGNTGADLSPGDPLCKEAAKEITLLKNEMDGEITNRQAAQSRCTDLEERIMHLNADISLLQQDQERFRWLLSVGIQQFKDMPEDIGQAREYIDSLRGETFKRIT